MNFRIKFLLVNEFPSYIYEISNGSYKPNMKTTFQINSFSIYVKYNGYITMTLGYGTP
jgi:hypothetical protein